jgi:shikimate 5-dehydrogenase/shikimate kinase
MRTVFIGHRGTGKSSLLNRVSHYYAEAGREASFLDLDMEIESRSGRLIRSIFLADGEEAFRKLERQTFAQIDQETSRSESDVYLALGAGFDPGLIPESWRVIWVRRASDEKGRIFMNRPRLDASRTALSEFQERYHRRHAAYRARADEVLWLEEGLEEPNQVERAFFLEGFSALEGAMTIKPEQLRSEKSLERWVRTRCRWGIRWFELRDDLLEEEQMIRLVALLPDERVLISFRDPARQASSLSLVEQYALAFDWPVEMGDCSFAEPRFLSLHERKEDQSLKEALDRFPTEVPSGTQLKAALPVKNFQELMEAHEWRSAQPESRIFLPLSADGRWAWYRLLAGRKADLNFFRESDGSGPDQPTLLQWARSCRLEDSSSGGALAFREFAALLGNPVSHSRTPMEHEAYFAPKHVPVYAVLVREDEWRAGALGALAKLGLRWASVTSPLKELAFESCDRKDELSLRMRAVNTLKLASVDSGIWMGTNTDVEGFRSAMMDISRAESDRGRSLGKVAVWGGGGTLGVVKAVLPEAQFFSLRSGENRDPAGVAAAEYLPDTVIWAVGSSLADVNDPPETWKPSLIVDLNYAEDSPGRAFALERECRYISGLSMFKAQAQGQRRFWGNS